MRASDAFFAPLTVTVPERFLAPRMTNLSTEDPDLKVYSLKLLAANITEYANKGKNGFLIHDLVFRPFFPYTFWDTGVRLSALS